MTSSDHLSSPLLPGSAGQPLCCDIAVVGAGPAGLAAGLEAALNGVSVILIEGEAEAGKKLLLTGGGRCNFSRRGTPADFVEGFHENGRFLYRALSLFDYRHYCDFLTREQVAIYCDPDQRFLTAEGRSDLVRKAFLKAFQRAGGKIYCRERIKKLTLPSPKSPSPGTAVDGRDHFELSSKTRTFKALAVILAGGAPCFPHTGSDGSLLNLARTAGLQQTALSAALCAIDLDDTDICELAGITLPACQITIRRKKKKLAVERGSLLFTHSGISGPVALNSSRWLVSSELTAELSFFPDRTAEEVFLELKEASRKKPKQALRKILKQHLPDALCCYLLKKSGLSPDRPAGEVAEQALRQLAVQLVKQQLPYKSLPSYDKGMTCRGGLALKNFDPHTLMARQIPGLFAAGDMLDLDGKSGGYNLQAAYATGRLAGLEAARFCQHSS